VGDVYRALETGAAARPATASEYLAEHPPRSGLRLPAGSWGANGDYSMWLNERTAWTWQRLWPLEQHFWDAAPAALADAARHSILAQAARELLLAQASDWQFIISTGAVADYAERRFIGHCEAAEELVAALSGRDGEAGLERARARAEEMRTRDDLFPDVVPAVAAALAGTRAQGRA
jgi:1,4-alpha-glucan branching enzyme